MSPLIALAVVAGLIGQAPIDRTVVATIDNEAVHASQVLNEINQAYRDKKLTEEARGAVLERAREQVIDRHLVLRYLTRTGQAASSQDVDFALAQLEKQLTSQGITLKDHCQRIGLEVADVRSLLAWKLSWNGYVEKHLTDQNLEKYFLLHKRDFDGTQIRVSQILLKPEGAGDQAAVDAAVARAEKLRGEIAGGKLSFAEAARVHSTAPSGKKGGDIGIISRHEPMPDDYSRAAFALEVGQISPPLVTSYGVHLLTATEIKPGTKTWQDVRSELKEAVTLYLFKWITERERPIAKIVLTEDWPQ